ncbi:prepilin-type N-terminal cleavage/methylation domain-containing protein [Candidatus Parcubacteria bacterium]|jgi:prepilin-type N-terminal cleavage/methylation domain-containing protein|nr:prepilin-type N-terminal cleavage/methylation domain-containing protein [Candidatus Parcubacteria bacterium]MBT7228418.1 prepilin-type N-terminal cleavage/methylation domain-containing protein [Candidatus Parcubacteria bacterium]
MSQNQKGFTLIEVIITLAVFTIGIVASFSLAIANLNSARDNFDRVSATNLAREGIELIRNTRDSNWLRADNNIICGTPPADYICNWDENLKSDFVYMDYTDITPITYGSCTLGSTMATCMGNCEADGSCELFINATNYHVHDPTGASATGMYRLIEINGICQNDSTGVENIIEGSMACNPLLETRVGIQVTSRVDWDSGSNEKHVDIVETFYNWRR